jgi:tetratricopeptide (TPR) repeat protein
MSETTNDNLKWLLLIPVIIVAIALAYIIPKLIGSDEDQTSTNKTDQALQLDIDDLQQRIDAYQGLVALNPGDIDSLRGLGDTYLEMGDLRSQNNQSNEALRAYKSAVDSYRKYLELNPAGAEVMIDLGLAYSDLYMGDIAVRQLRAATQTDPTNQRAWHVLGYVLENNLGDTDGAVQAWQTSYNLDPNSTIGQESKQFIDQSAGTTAGGTQLPTPAP